MSVTITKDMLIWGDKRCGLYKHPKQGYVLIEFATGDGRWMPVRQAKDWLRIVSQREAHNETP